MFKESKCVRQTLQGVDKKIDSRNEYGVTFETRSMLQNSQSRDSESQGRQALAYRTHSACSGALAAPAGSPRVSAASPEGAQRTLVWSYQRLRLCLPFCPALKVLSLLNGRRGFSVWARKIKQEVDFSHI